jgi:hypothetical protein
MNAAATRQNLRDGNFLRVRNLWEELVERVDQLQLSFLDELQDSSWREHFCDRIDPESAGAVKVSVRLR